MMKPKKADMGFGWVVKLIILGLVITIVYLTMVKPLFDDVAPSALNTLELERFERFCQAGQCPTVEKCEEVSDVCTKEDVELWLKFVAWQEQCNNKLKNDPSDSCKETNLYAAIGNAGVPTSGDPTLTTSSISSFLRHPFYTNNKNQLEQFAQQNNFDVEILYAIIIKEGGYKVDFDSSIRFECHKFNRANPSQEVPCTVTEKGFSETPSETNKAAYERAKEIDPELAFKSSSSGFAQILGENYVRYVTITDFETAMNVVRPENVQIESYFKFLQGTSGLIVAMQDKDWAKIAELYNGKGYAANAYDVDLQFAFNELSRNEQVS